MLDIEEILKKFMTLSGVSEQDAEKWRSVCEDSAKDICSKLREGVSEEENKEKLISSAAALSYYKYVLCASVRDDLNPENQYISNPYTKSLASSIWQEYKNSMSSLICDTNFVFKKII